MNDDDTAAAGAEATRTDAIAAAVMTAADD